MICSRVKIHSPLTYVDFEGKIIFNREKKRIKENNSTKKRLKKLKEIFE